MSNGEPEQAQEPAVSVQETGVGREALNAVAHAIVRADASVDGLIVGDVLDAIRSTTRDRQSSPRTRRLEQLEAEILLERQSHE